MRYFFLMLAVMLFCTKMDTFCQPIRAKVVLTGNINGKDVSGSFDGSNVDGHSTLRGSLNNQETIRNLICVVPIVVTLYCPVKTTGDGCANPAPDLGSFVGARYSRHVVITFADGSSLTIDGNMDLNTGQCVQTINGSVPADYIPSTSEKCDYADLSFTMRGMNSGTIIYSGTYNVTLSGANKSIHVECSYFYDSGKVMTKPQTMQIQHPSVIISSNNLDLSQDVSMCY